jgi:hypothetical protein
MTALGSCPIASFDNVCVSDLNMIFMQIIINRYESVQYRYYRLASVPVFVEGFHEMNYWNNGIAYFL